MDGFRDGTENPMGNPMANQAMNMAMSNPEMIAGLFENQMALDHATLAAVYEQHHIEALRELEQEVGIEDPVEAPTVEDRAQGLIRAFQSLITGNPRRQYLLDVVGISEEKVDTALTYVNADADEWNEQADEWIEMWHEQGAEGTERELINRTIRENFGVPANRFREKVLHQGDKAEVTMELIAGPSHGTTQRLHDVRERIADSDADGE